MTGDATFELSCTHCGGRFRLLALGLFGQIDWRLQDGSTYTEQRVPVLPIACTHCGAELQIGLSLHVIEPEKVRHRTDRLVGQRSFVLLGEDALGADTDEERARHYVVCPRHAPPSCAPVFAVEIDGVMTCTRCLAEEGGRMLLDNDCDGGDDEQATWSCAGCGDRQVSAEGAKCLMCSNRGEDVEGTGRLPDAPRA